MKCRIDKIIKNIITFNNAIKNYFFAFKYFFIYFINNIL